MIKSAWQQSKFILQALQNERQSPAGIRALQNRKLRAMAQYAYASSPFYRARFDAAGLKPEQIQTVADLVKLPPTTKAELQEAGEDQVVAHGFSPVNTILEATSGSSGKVLNTYHAPDAFNHYFAFAFRHLWDIGYRPWHRVAYTSFDPLRPLPWEKIGLGKRHQIDLTDKNPRAYVEALLRIRPHLITAYPSILQLVINTATPAELAQIRPQVIHLHSELLNDSLRSQIREAFACDCFDDYSTFEFHHVAYECHRHRYHLAADNVIVEFVRHGQPVGPDEEGEILLTGLTNRAMPLFRYAIGDIGIPSNEQCPCGCGFPTMKLIQGRVDDFIVVPDGRTFSPRMINPVYEYLPGIMEHVLVQEAIDRMVVYVNIAPAYAASTPALVKEVLGDLFGAAVQIDVIVTTEFERGRTGKLRNVVSKVNRGVVYA